MTPETKPFGWCAYHFHASDLHLIVTLTVFLRQAQAAGAVVGDALSERFSASLASAARAAELPGDSMVQVVYEPSPESIRSHCLAALSKALASGYAGMWMVVYPSPSPAVPASREELDLAWSHLTEHYPISVLHVVPFDERATLVSGSLRRRHLYHYSAGRLIR